MKFYGNVKLVTLVLLLANVIVLVHTHGFVIQTAVVSKNPLNVIRSASTSKQTKLVILRQT